MERFSIKRTGLLIQYYWRTEKNMAATIFFIMLAAYLGVQVIDAMSHHQLAPPSLLYWVMVCSVVNTGIHQFYFKKESTIVAFTLPASNLEKFLSRVIYVSVGALLMATVAELLSALICVGFALGMDYLAGNPYNPQIVRYYFSLNDWTFVSRLTGEVPLLAALKALFYFTLLVLPVLSVFTLCSLLFHRWGFLVSTLLILTFVFSQMVFVGVLHGPGVSAYWSKLFCFFVLVTIVCYGLSYRSFCRQEMRKKWIHI